LPRRALQASAGGRAGPRRGVMSRQVVALTGCTRGMGRALLESFVQRGFKVAGCGTNEERLEELRKAHQGCRFSRVDVRSEESVAAWLKDVADAWGPVDVLVCNAAVFPECRKFEDIPEKDWAETCDVNICGVARVLRHAVQRLRSPGATVVLLSSRYGRTVTRELGCYSATKWAIESMAKTLALEQRDRGIAAVSLDPGIVDTDMFRTSNPSGHACGEISPADFAEKAVPLILSVGMADTGRNLTTPGSPPAYFHTGVAYKDRPAWANGFSPFVLAREDEGVAAAKRRRTEGASAAQESARPHGAGAADNAAEPLRYFISGVMLGSRPRLDEQCANMVPQDFREKIAQIIRQADPTAVVVEPLDVVKRRAEGFGMTLGQLSQHTEMVRESFEEVVELAAECDVVVSNLPEASMGSAVELWEARRAGRHVLTISPLKDNWLLRSTSHHNFADLEEFERGLKEHLPKRTAAPK